MDTGSASTITRSMLVPNLRLAIVIAKTQITMIEHIKIHTTLEPRVFSWGEKIAKRAIRKKVCLTAMYCIP